MNAYYWGESEVKTNNDDRDVEPTNNPHTSDHGQPEPQLRLVSETLDARRAAEEALIDQWLAERQCSGV